MQTGYISFCDSTAFNIKSGNVKQDILKTIENLSNIKIIQKHFDIFNKIIDRMAWHGKNNNIFQVSSYLAEV